MAKLHRKQLHVTFKKKRPAKKRGFISLRLSCDSMQPSSSSWGKKKRLDVVRILAFLTPCAAIAFELCSIWIFIPFDPFYFKRAMQMPALSAFRAESLPFFNEWLDVIGVRKTA